MNMKHEIAITTLVLSLSACGMQTVPDTLPATKQSPVSAEELSKAVDQKIDEAATAYEELPISRVSTIEFQSDSRDRITKLKFLDLRGNEVKLLEDFELRENAKGLLSEEGGSADILLLTLHSKLGQKEVDLLVVPGIHKVVALSSMADAPFGDVDVQSLSGEWVDGEWVPTLFVQVKSEDRAREYAVDLVRNQRGQVVGLGLDFMN